MQWQEIRRHHPDCWLLVEAIKAHSANGQRILEDLAVIEVFEDSDSAMKSYCRFHKESPQRELMYSIPNVKSSTLPNGDGRASAVCDARYRRSICNTAR